MDGLEPRAFERACLERDQALAKLESMRAATDISELATLWSEFLIVTQRCFTKLRIATQNGPKKGWFDQVLRVQKTDELLRYVLHARNADEHGIVPITKASTSELIIGSNPGGGSTYVRSVSLGADGRVHVDADNPGALRVSFTPAGVHLVPVIDRGEIFPVPRRHLSQPFTDPTLLAVAECATIYLDSLIEEAFQDEVRPKRGE